MGADTPEDARRVAELLPTGTPVYVNHLPSRDLDHTLPALVALRTRAGAGAAHRCAPGRSREQVQGLPAAGDQDGRGRQAVADRRRRDKPVGPYDSAAALLRDGPIADCGIQQIGFAGYPEGHPRIPTATLRAALDEKLALARDQGLAAYVVTQFCFAPNRIAEYCAELARRAPTTPVYVGLAGPANPVALLRYAQRCGVGARCARCSRRAWAPCGSSRTPIRPSSSPRLPAIAAAAAPARWWGCISTASAASPAPPAG
jgi:methylenetetrahydrofolate reductase (NADPH)